MTEQGDDSAAQARPESTDRAAPTSSVLTRLALYGAAGLAVMAVGTSAVLWQKLSNIQEQLARQSADSGAQAIEARALARQAADDTRDVSARLAVMETRLGEVALQRTQLEELIQSLSRSRDENLVVDIDAAVRLAVQQSQLTGSAEPLLAALKSAEQRLARAAQPRLSRVRAALGRDIERIKSANLIDLPSMLLRLDELVRQIDELSVANAVASPASAPARAQPVDTLSGWWQQAWGMVRDELRSLVRVSRIDQPDAALLAPEQAFFLRENLKLKLLNARLGLLSRQTDSVRSDLSGAATLLSRYFDSSSRRTQAALTTLQQLQAQTRALEVPRVDDTLAALATAAAGR